MGGVGFDIVLLTKAPLAKLGAVAAWKLALDGFATDTSHPRG